MTDRSQEDPRPQPSTNHAGSVSSGNMELPESQCRQAGIMACSRTLFTVQTETVAIPRALSHLRECIDASRAYLIENLNDPTEGLCLRQTYESFAPDLGSKYKVANYEQVPYKNGFSRWQEVLSNGKEIVGTADSFPDDERLLLENQGIASILVLPVFAGKKWHGVLGFDDLSSPRQWSDECIDILRTGAEMIGVYYQRQDALLVLQKNEERYRLLTENATDMISHCRPDGVYLYVSPACKTLLGYRPDELVGQSMFDHVHSDDINTVRRFHDTLLEDATDFTISYRMMRCDGSEVWVENSIRALYNPDHGGISEIIIVSRDITERRRVENELRAYTIAQRNMNLELEAQKQQLQAQQFELEAINCELEKARNAAETASQSKSEFLANMSHEIRTPMTAILGYADLLREDGLDDRAQRHHLETIRRNGEHLLTIINDILDLSKIEAGKLETERVKCDVTQLIADVMSIMDVRAKDKNLSLAVEYHENTPKEIVTDAVRLRQILVNIAGNAVKFTETGGVTIRVGLLPDSPKGRPLLQIEIIDTGIGMNQDQLDSLFKPFSQADASMSRRFGGTGLGLAISKRLTEMLGGGVEVTSQPGKGSRFVITVYPGPIKNAKTITKDDTRIVKNTAVKTQIEQLSGRVLLAEDGPDNQRLITIVLKKAGLDVDVAENGRIACEMAIKAHVSGKPYDLILMDMQMPEMDGYSATRHLRNEGYTLPIVALTAHAMRGDREKCIDAGCSDFATKPISRHSLLTSCDKWLSRTKIETPGK